MPAHSAFVLFLDFLDNKVHLFSRSFAQFYPIYFLPSSSSAEINIDSNLEVLFPLKDTLIYLMLGKVVIKSIIQNAKTFSVSVSSFWLCYRIRVPIS